MSVEVLVRIEDILRQRLGKGPDFVLSDYFDFVAGTSTGAVIGACVASGIPAAKVRRFYVESGKELFVPALVFNRLHHKYDSEPIAQKIQAELGADTKLGSDRLKTMLMMVMRNATTDSPWPVSNNPFALYNLRAEARRLAARKLQSGTAALAARAGEHRGADVLSARGSDGRRQDVHLRRWRSNHVQQPSVPRLCHGNCRAVRSAMAGW